MGVPVSTGPLLKFMLIAAAVCIVAAADSGCSQGDTACFCKSIGGTWRALQAPLLPACKITYQHQGAERYVHVYLPPTYDGTTQWPIWVHLHGVFWATMGDIGSRVGHPVNGTDIIPAFDHSVELMGDKAILVYPQSTGDAGTGAADEGQGQKYRQFWSIPFWHCSVGICRDPSIDDMGFIEKVVVDLPKRLPLKPNHYLLTGESAGGMMVHAILCQSKVIPDVVDAAIDMLGGIGADYARGPECAGHKPVPFLKLHGIEDPFITYSKDILVDGVNFASSIEGTQLHAKSNGCGASDVGSKDVPEADGKMLCTDYCGGDPDKLPAKLCGMPGVGHDTDHPHPGFVYEQSWAWFQEQVKAAAGRKPAKRARVGPARPAEPLVMSITYPGTTAEDFKGEKGAAAIAAVSKATGLPADNITATYHAASPAAATAAVQETAGSAASSSSRGGSRKLRRHLTAAAAEDAGVTGRYALQTTDPSKVAETIVAAVKDGSLLQTLQQSGLAAAAGSSGAQQQGPVVTLAATAGASAQQVLLKATDLVAAAAKTVPVTAAPAPKADSSSSSTTASAAAPASLPGGPDVPVAASAAAHGSSSSSSSSSSIKPNIGVIVGAVVGGICGAALFAGAAFWAVSFRKRKQQQQQQAQFEQVHSDAWDKQQQLQQQKQQQRPGVINLNADAVMCISDDTVQAKGWDRTWS